MRYKKTFPAFFMVYLFSFSCEKNPTESTWKVPELTTSEVTDIGATSVTCGGTIISDGGATITARGVCWSTSQKPKVSDNKTSDGTGADSFTSEITGLRAGTTYYVRAYATNSTGTGYGGIIQFTKHEIGTVTDIDGNMYRTVRIGSQWWMAENLKVTHYQNGDALPNVTDNAAWFWLNSGAYCNYGNNATNSDTYGRLYNWYAVHDYRNIAPIGWHVPSDVEWQIMVNYFLGGDEVAGGKLKEIGTTHWNSPNYGATNESGFSALPGGERDLGGSYYYIGENGYWWSFTEDDKNCASQIALYYSSSFIWYWSDFKQDGFSVRCVKY
ncbi:MAG: FISUMP domain-containing protein [archaeon]